MAKPLNTKRLLKECKQIAAKQKKEAMPMAGPVYVTPAEVEQAYSSIIDYIEPISTPSNAAELETYLSQFSRIMAQANKRYNEAVETELLTNSALQDIAHVIEFNDSLLDGIDVTELIRTWREKRRQAKVELEVAELIKKWADAAQSQLNKLNEVLGETRKVIARQAAPFYLYKSDVIGQKGNPMPERPTP